MAGDTKLALLFEKLKLDDPYVPPGPWESIPSESGFSSSSAGTNNGSTHVQYSTSAVSESSLVRLALDALQGVESALISIQKLFALFCFDSADRSFHHIPSLWTRTSSTLALGNLLKSIGKFGCIIFLLHKFVHHFTCLSLDGKSNTTLVNQAFAVSVAKILNGYISALNTLYASVPSRRCSEANCGITLLEAYLHTTGLRAQMEVLGHICNMSDLALRYYLELSLEEISAKALLKLSDFPKSGALLTFLYTQLKVADPTHCTLLKFLFLRSWEPCCGFIRSWIFEGTVADPFEEFMVENMTEQLDHEPGNSGISHDFPFASFRVREGVLPLFLEDCLVPLFRAGQQVQIITKLLELSHHTSGSFNNGIHEEFLPGINGFSSEFSSFKSSLLFEKGTIETMVASRNGYYQSMLEKVNDVFTKLEFRVQEISLHGHASNWNSTSLISNSDNSVKYSNDTGDQKLPHITVEAETSTDNYDFSCTESESSLSEEDSEFDLPNNTPPDYLSAVCFTTDENHKFPQDEISEYVSHNQTCEKMEIFNNECESSFTYGSEDHNFDSGFFSIQTASESSWKLKHHSGFFSMNPILTKNSLVNPKRDSRQPFPIFNFTSIRDPCKVYIEKFTSSSSDKFGAEVCIKDRSDESSEKMAEPPHTCPLVGSTGACNVTVSSLEKNDAGSKAAHNENVSSLEKNAASGGSGWERLLANSSEIFGTTTVKYPKTSLVTSVEMPLDHIIKKCLKEEILLQYKYLSKLTMKLLEDGFSLREHLVALRRYHFMEIADWAHLFITSLQNHKWYSIDAEKRISEIQSILELSVQRSSCEADPCKDRLYVYVKESSVKNISVSSRGTFYGIHSFDFLGLGYRVDWPVSIILSPGALRIYSDIFSFLIQVKLAVVSLTDTWRLLKDLSQLNKKNHHLESDSAEPKQLSILTETRHQLNHFATTLQQYVQSQLSHVSWGIFMCSLKDKVKDMMDLHSAHMAYLDESLHICFLSKETQHIASIIRNILQFAVDFRSCLSGDISQVIRMRKSISENIKGLYVCYLKSPKHGESGLSSFWERLNYNDHYSEVIGKQMGHNIFLM